MTDLFASPAPKTMEECFELQARFVNELDDICHGQWCLFINHFWPDDEVKEAFLNEIWDD